MCGRFTLTAPLSSIAARFEFREEQLVWRPRYNIAPTQQVLAVVYGEEQRQAGYLRWGLIPSWAKDSAIGQRMINARAETVADKPSFRNAFARRRCLIPADSFYEWVGPPRRKQPYRIMLADQQLFAMAGLWERWLSPTGEEIVSCTIITTEPNEHVSRYHNRMPVILPEDAESVWLDPQTSTDELHDLLRPYPAKDMVSYPVNRRVNSVRNDDPGCIKPPNDIEEVEYQ